MTNAQLFAIWGWSLVVAAVVVVLAAVLLIAIILVARRILGHARQAREAVEEIAESTAPIWALDETNRLAEEVLETAEDIEELGGHLAGTLHGERAPSAGGLA